MNPSERAAIKKHERDQEQISGEIGRPAGDGRKGWDSDEQGPKYQREMAGPTWLTAAPKQSTGANPRGA